ncbi:MAG TPA: hypothetical protein VH083_01295, partial [Myxococcales bacterium]|nr:hypothetical protein [Myxococcales bacterium]
MVDHTKFAKRRTRVDVARAAARALSRMPELNHKAIPELTRGGWRLCTVEEMALVGTVEKNYLVYGSDPNPASDENV